jgi:hypothetical protein
VTAARHNRVVRHIPAERLELCEERVFPALAVVDKLSGAITRHAHSVVPRYIDGISRRSVLTSWQTHVLENLHLVPAILPRIAIDVKVGINIDSCSP